MWHFRIVCHFLSNGCFCIRHIDVRWLCLQHGMQVANKDTRTQLCCQNSLYRRSFTRKICNVHTTLEGQPFRHNPADWIFVVWAIVFAVFVLFVDVQLIVDISKGRHINKNPFQMVSVGLDQTVKPRPSVVDQFISNGLSPMGRSTFNGECSNAV